MERVKGDHVAQTQHVVLDQDCAGWNRPQRYPERYPIASAPAIETLVGRCVYFLGLPMSTLRIPKLSPLGRSCKVAISIGLSTIIRPLASRA